MSNKKPIPKKIVVAETKPTAETKAENSTIPVKPTAKAKKKPIPRVKEQKKEEPVTKPDPASMFGDLGNTPEPISEIKIEAPEPAIPFNDNFLLEEEDSKKSSAIDDMVEDALIDEDGDLDAKENQLDDLDDWTDIITEYAPELLNGFRMFAHVPLYNHLISDKDEEEEYKALYTKDKRSPKEQERLDTLHKRVFYRKQSKADFAKKIPYSAKQEKRVQAVIKRVVAQIDGNNTPLWLVLLLVFVLPEAILLSKSFIDKMSLPE